MIRFCLMAAVAAVFCMTTEATAQVLRGHGCGPSDCCQAEFYSTSCCAHPCPNQRHSCGLLARLRARCQDRRCDPCPATSYGCQELQDPYLECLDWCDANCGPFTKGNCKRYCYCIYHSANPQLCIAPLICNPYPSGPPMGGFHSGYPVATGCDSAPCCAAANSCAPQRRCLLGRLRGRR